MHRGEVIIGLCRSWSRLLFSIGH